MAETTEIQWTDSTFNPWEGCQKVGPGCDHCYAESRNARFGGGVAVNWGPAAPRRRTSASNWQQPRKWNAQHEAFFAEHGRRRRVFCASLADVFDNQVLQEWRDDLFALIAATPHLDWLLLTKRIGNVRKMVSPAWLDPGGWPAHVRIGISVVNQAEADRDIVQLLQLPCPNFLSMEPLLAHVALWRWAAPHCERHPGKLESDGTCAVCEGRGIWAIPGDAMSDQEKAPIRAGLDWVIVGGESGPGARPMHPGWVRSLRDQCQAAGVPFLFKQWGEWWPIDQMQEEDWQPFYKSRRKARDGEDQDALDDSYGRDCIVANGMVHRDGSLHDILAPMAALQGTGCMQTFKAGKKAAGRLLDGVEHNGFPEVTTC